MREEERAQLKAAIRRAEGTLHQINGHWWNRRVRPDARDLRLLIDAAKANVGGQHDR